MYKINGEYYDFKKIFDSDDEADLFLERVETTKFYRNVFCGYLTIWYSVSTHYEYKTYPSLWDEMFGG